MEYLKLFEEFSFNTYRCKVNGEEFIISEEEFNKLRSIAKNKPDR